MSRYWSRFHCIMHTCNHVTCNVHHRCLHFFYHQGVYALYYFFLQATSPVVQLWRAMWEKWTLSYRFASNLRRWVHHFCHWDRLRLHLSVYVRLMHLIVETLCKITVDRDIFGGKNVSVCMPTRMYKIFSVFNFCRGRSSMKISNLS